MEEDMNGYDFLKLMKERKNNTSVWWKYILDAHPEYNLIIVSFPKRLEKNILENLKLNRVSYHLINEKNRKLGSVIISKDKEERANKIFEMAINFNKTKLQKLKDKVLRR